MSEARLQTSIKKALESIDCIVQKIQPPPVGVPDLLIIYEPGKHFWGEVKTPTGQLSKAQQAYHHLLRLKHENVYTIRSVEYALKLVDGFRSQRLPEKSHISDYPAA